MCFSVLAHDAASPWAERSKQITTITSDWSLILHHGLLFIYREKCKEHFTHPILPDALIYFIILLLFPFASVTVDILFFGSVMISFCISATSWTRYWFMYFLPFLYQIVYSTLVLIWFVYICCTGFFCFFCDWRRQDKANMSTVIQYFRNKRRRHCRHWRASHCRMLPNQ